jgi:integrase
LVTAKHVLFDPNTGKILDTSFDLLSYSKDLSDPTPNSFTKGSRNEARDRCLVLLMFRHGLRVSEACRMKLD